MTDDPHLLHHESRQTLYRQIPGINKLLRDAEFLPLIQRYGHRQLAAVLRQLQQQARSAINDTGKLPAWCADWRQQAAVMLARSEQPALRSVFNLTGTVLHTNLGRALLAQTAVQAVNRVMSKPVALEYDLRHGQRGHRDRPLAALLCQLTGAEDACVVNNNAAAVLLMLSATASGKSVLLSRGELVEIGGEFRIPDVMRQAGCHLCEVGTTNRTHARDYRQAATSDTALIMKVHTSNYQIVGFSKAVDVDELAAISAELALPLVVDLGSGALVDLCQYGLPVEPTPQAMIAAGASLVSFSADKLCGGPQAGIIVGKKALIDQLQRHPLKRALRADKMTLAALEATLRLYLQPETLADQLPTLRLLTRCQADIHAQAQRLLPPLAARYAGEFQVEIRDCWSQIGSGALPVDTLASSAITFTPVDKDGGTVNQLANRWRQLAVPVIGRVATGRLWLDLRCLEPDDEATLLEMLLQ